MDFMIDLETFGVDVSAPVFSVGCVPVQQPESEGFYTLVQPEGDPGFSTIGYWLQQAVNNPDSAKQAILAIADGVEYTTALLDLFDYMRRTWAMSYDGTNVPPSEREGMRVWSKGSIFDIAILRRAAEHRSLDVPWHFRDEMCFRTMERMLGKGVDNPPDGLAHHGLEDARWQARKLNNILDAQKGNPHLGF